MSAPEASTALLERLRELARTSVLLVGSDFDGTLSPLVDDPSRAAGNPDSLRALRLLAGLPHTHVAIVSGRALRDLALLSRMPVEVHLVGSHGSEFDAGVSGALDDGMRRRVAAMTRELEGIAAGHDGIRLEPKPTGVAVHYRTASRDTADAVLQAVLAGPATRDGVHVKHGKQVVELSVMQANKGACIARLRQEVGASAVLFLGDDLTDEDVFASLGGPDLGVLVGEGSTGASTRLADTGEVARMLAYLYEVRRDWVLGVGAVPIERHALLANGRQCAVVSPNGRIGWLCYPRPDSPSLFAELVGGESGGSFEVSSARSAAPLSQRYVGDSMVLQTRFPGITVHDYLDEPPAKSDAETGPMRLVRVVTGHERARVVFAPRPDYGGAPMGLEAVADDAGAPLGLSVTGAALQAVLRATGVSWTLSKGGGRVTATAEIDLRNGPVVFELRCGTRDLGPDPVPEAARRQRAVDAWTSWSARLRLPALAAEAVRRSALVLRALWYQPTGAFVAAATTSLPAHLGGVRNWDYRYAWIRDGALAARSLVRLGACDEALAFVGWLDRVFARVPDPGQIMPMYAVSGGDPGVEAVLAQLPGYAGSRPVRIGNAALHQVQLDVFGPVVDLVLALAEAGAAPGDAAYALVEALVGAVRARWCEPDHGIWEIRLPPRHHVHSRVLCWVAVDRAIRLWRHRGLAPPADWIALRDAIHAETLERGWSDALRSFVVAYGIEELDASLLQIVASGFLPTDDARAAATLHAVDIALRAGPTVYRYRYDDGIAGHDAGFHLCTGWLIESYVRTGRLEDARDLFQQLLSLAGPTGLLSEGYDPVTDRALGNFPQAYSHIAIIDAAVAIAGAMPGAMPIAR